MNIYINPYPWRERIASNIDMFTNTIISENVKIIDNEHRFLSKRENGNIYVKNVSAIL